MNTTRKLTIHRKSNISGMAMKFKVYIDNVHVGMLANGAALEADIDMNAHQLSIVPSVPLVKAPRPVHIPAGFGNQAALVQIKNSGLFQLGPAEWTLELEKSAASDHEDALGLFTGFLLILASRREKGSLTPKMEEFRRQGYDLHVRFIFGETGVTVSPEEVTAGCFQGEAFDVNYGEITSGAISALSMQDRLQLAGEFEQMIRSSPDHSHLKAEGFGAMVKVSLR